MSPVTSFRAAPWLAALALSTSGCVTLTKPERAAQAVVKAQELRADRKLAEASAAYEKALDLDHTNLAALRGYVETRQKLGRIREAEARFTHELAANPRDAFAHEGLGLTFYAMGGARTSDAAGELAKAVELAPEQHDFRYRYGVLLVESDRWEEAVQQLAKAVEAEPRRARYRLPYAVALARLGKHREAVAELQTVLSSSPTPDEVAQAERAGQALTDPFRGFPQAAREQFELALGWLSHESLSQAQLVLDSLLEKFPDLAIVHAMSGLCAAKLDDAGRAIVALRKATELGPDLAEPRLFLGDIYNARGRPDEAREHYEAALARNPFLVDAYKRLAEGHIKAGEKDKAVARFATYLLLRPDDFDVQIARATLESELGRPEAQAAWDGIAKRFPRRPEALVGRARWYYSRGVQAPTPLERKEARAEARKSLEAALELDAENRTAAAMLGELGKLPD